DGLRLRRLPRLPGRAPRGRLSLHLRRRPLRGGRRGGLGPTGVRMIDLSVSIGRVRLKNPVLTASGTFGYGLEYDEFFDVAELGGICTKGLSVEPRAGNAPARICETSAGMLNAIGLANVGVEAFCRDKLP